MPYIKKHSVNQYEAGCLDEQIREDNPVRLYRLVTDLYVASNQENLNKEENNGAGRPEYHPADMLCLLLYGYINRISSSRRLEKECHRNIEVKWMMGRLTPDHWTINNFRKNNKELIGGLVRQFRKFLRDEDLIDGQAVMIDGTKLKANNRKEMLKVTELRDMVRKGEEDISRYLDQLDRIDKMEDEEENLESMREERERLAKELEELKEKTEKQKARYEKAKQGGVKYIGTSDEDSRLMLSRNGKVPGYNLQVAVDSKNHLIVGNLVTQEVVDSYQLKPVVEGLIAEEMPVKTVVADKGYSTLNEIERIERQTKVECVVPIPNLPGEDKGLKYIYETQSNEYICPTGKRLVLLQKGKKDNRGRDVNSSIYICKECDGCQIRQQCTTSKWGRRIKRHWNQEWRETYSKRMNRENNKSLIAHRKGVVEHVFGTLRLYMGAVPLLLRGLVGVGIETDLYVQAYNFRRLLNIMEFNDLMCRVSGFNWKMA